MTLNGPNALLQKKTFYGPTRKIEDRPILSAAECGLMFLVPRNIRRADIRGFPWRGASKDNGGCERC